MARPVLPKSRVRRTDVLVVALRLVWIYGWMAADFVERANGTRLPALSLMVVLFVFGASSFEVPFLLGMAKGRRWGFVSVAILSAWGGLAEVTHPPLVGKPVTSLHVAFATFDLALVAYCVVRAQQDGTRRPDSPRTPLLRFTDVLAGALSLIWALALLGTLFGATIRMPLRPFDRSMLLFCAALGLAYGGVAIGLVLGKRWGLVWMVVASALVLILESRMFFTWRGGMPMVGIGMAAFNVVTLAYAAIRLLWLQPSGVRTTALPPS